jgi:DNA-binding MarR family transcriptional regulator
MDNLEKTIIEDIFCLHNSLMSLANEGVFKKNQITLNLYISLQMISSGLGNIVDMREVVKESAASLGKKINKLEELKLVKRTVNKADKRKWDFSLTKKGLVKTKIIEKEFDHFCKKILSQLEQEDKVGLHKKINILENIIK